MICNLDNYIGVRGCAEPPESGLYINDIPGVTTRGASNVVNGEVVRGDRLLENCIKQAYTDVMHDIISELASVGYVWKGQQTRHSQYVLSTGQFTGLFALDIETCRFQKVRVNTLEVNSTAAQTVKVNGIEFDVQEGRNTLEVNLELSYGDQLIFEADLPVLKYQNNSCDCFCGGNYPVGITIYEFCDECELAYEYRHLLKKAFQVRAAIIYFQHAAVTEQTSQEARHGQSISGRMLAQLMGGIDPVNGIQFKGEYPAIMKNITRAFKYEASRLKCCFSCELYQHLYVNV
jgi:hypothetical protein